MRTLYYVYILIALAFIGLAGTASATFTGPCTATVAGADLKTQDVVEVQAGSMVDYAFSAETPVSTYLMALTYGPFQATPSSGVIGDPEQTSVVGSVNLEDYAWMGGGLYTLEGSVGLVDGSVCQGSINVNIVGVNPLTTVAGGSAAVIAGASTISLVVMFLKGSGIILAA